ncbi:MAG: YjgN family protein [Magnetococcus sp. WYHC-3]
MTLEPLALAASTTSAAPPPQWRPVVFSGEGSAYFRIWIVNIALTIVTLGIYSPWAKVRRTRYFYQHTQVDGHALDYDARPVDILKGRVVAALYLLGMGAALNAPDARLLPIGLGMQVLLGLLLPLILVWSMRFSLRNTLYRNIRFRFTGSIGGAYGAVLLWPLLSALSLGLLLPVALWAQRRYLMQGCALGRTALHFAEPLRLRHVYRIHAQAALLTLPWLGMVVLYLALTLSALSPDASIPDLGLLPPLIFLGFIYIAAWVNAALFHLVWNRVALGDIRFRCSLSPWRAAWIHISNLVLRIVTLGLASPWCRIRWVRYQSTSLSLLMSDEQGAAFLQAQTRRHPSEGGVAEGLDDLGGFDLSL